MIVRAIDGKLLLVRQTDHQVLAGQLAEAWGNGQFARPEPYAPIVRAAYEHDNGWFDWETAPKIDPATGRPYQFTDVPVEDHLAFYRRGIDELADRDPHAGLLVNLHCQGFHNQRFGTMPEAVMKSHPPEKETAVKRFVTSLQAQTRELGRLISVDLPTLWGQYELLQVFDRMSLYLCMPPLKHAELGPVPVRPGGKMLALRLTPAEYIVRIDPWPFREQSVAASVPGRRVPDRRYANDDEFRNELNRAEAVTLTYALGAL